VNQPEPTAPRGIYWHVPFRRYNSATNPIWIGPTGHLAIPSRMDRGITPDEAWHMAIDILAAVEESRRRGPLGEPQPTGHVPLTALPTPTRALMPWDALALAALCNSAQDPTRGLSPRCVLDREHGGNVHQADDGFTWPVQAPSTGDGA
jgi:hypothetical protein